MADQKITELEDIADKCHGNHIWLNAFSCIDPSDEFCRDIGQTIIDKLNNKDRLLSGYVKPEDRDIPEMLSLAELTPMLYIAINKS